MIEARALNARAHEQPLWLHRGFWRFCVPEFSNTTTRTRGREDAKCVLSLALALCVPEVIAHGEQTVEALQTPRMCVIDPGRLVSSPQAQAGGAPGEYRLAQLVQSAGLGQAASACPAHAGAVLSGMRPAGSSHQGDGGGPCDALPGGLDVVRRPGQSTEFVQAPSRPKDSPGAS